MTTNNVPSEILAARLEKLRRKALDARYSRATADELASIGQEIEEAQKELFQKRAEEQKQRQAEANARMLAARSDVSSEHLQWQEGRGSDVGSYTRGSLRR